ncbi:hypothetical protein L249_5117 [Ophiocordyceps polyrhachis-furcata BCC 54312]|uniref:DNA helicase n=1 Tax=Ophiocordyceps polyrhachis-furcata BCC 54312 TaxID=1330021 RepID=A0A367L3C1_9HYPO|nr:hypothetical protein L249_5117 [Ophiocordyceps polyrhachis-furcata BCC 54312]
MPETAPPRSRPAIADPTSPGAASEDLSPPPDSPHVSEHASDLGVDVPPRDGRVEPDAIPQTTNGREDSDLDDADAVDSRPLKRRRIGDPTSPVPAVRKSKQESPPWRRVEPEGPTSFTENGRRKSGRINNVVPREVQPRDKRRSTRRSLNTLAGPAPKKDELPIFSHGSKESTQPARRTAITPKAVITNPPPPLRTSSRSTRRPSPSPRPQATRYSTRRRRVSHLTDNADDTNSETPNEGSWQARHDEGTSLPRIKLRISNSGLIPLVHPDQVRKRPKLGSSFQDFWDRAGSIPVEQGGLQASEDGPAYTDEMALRDAQSILRIEEEAEPGGLLSEDRCSLFAPEAAQEPPKQWTRQDHMVKAMANFRKLLVAEQQRHRAAAKKLADACRDEWLRRQPKSAEEIEAEEQEKWITRYRLVVKAMLGTWENVRAHVNRQRLEQWEAEEQKRVKAALNQAVSLSEQKLQARRGRGDSEEEGFDDDLSDVNSVTGSDDRRLGKAGDGDDDGDVEDSDNMSTTDDEDDDDDDDGSLRHAADELLSQEQLRAKYAYLDDPRQSEDHDENAGFTSHDASSSKPDADLACDESDESVDMDDDLGDSDMDSEGGPEAVSDASDESGVETRGLLGLLFEKPELKHLKASASQATHVFDGHDGTTSGIDGTGYSKGDVSDASGLVDQTLEDDDDEMSLVRHPDSVFGDASEGEAGHAAGLGRSPAPGDTTTVDPYGPIESDQTDIGVVSTPEKSLVALDDAAMDPQAGAQVPFDRLAKPEGCLVISPETEAATNPASPRHSQSPRTSDTKPSELDAASTADAAPAKTGTRRSSSAQEYARHKTEIPFLLRGTLREYQHDGLDWLAGLYANNTNGILADEMGLGKTIQTIALLAHLACHHEVWGPHLVVVPTSVMLNWEMEFKKWCPGFKILAYYGSQEERKRKRQGWTNDDVWNVCVTSYQLVLQDQQVFRRRRWHFMVLDEAHNIKNFKSQRWQTLLGFNTHSRLLLTGTPLQNNLTELWSLLFFLMPAENGEGGFADLQEFHDWFRKPESQILESGRDQMDDEAKAIISKLHKVLRPYLLRRLKADVEKQMPAKYEHVEFCRLSKRQRELYDGFLSRSDTRETLASGNYLSIINCLMQLRKVCNHPDLFVDRPIMTSFRMSRSVAAGYEATERRVRHSLLPDDPMAAVSLVFLNLVPTEQENVSTAQAHEVTHLNSHSKLVELREAQRKRAQAGCTRLDPSTLWSCIDYLEGTARWDRFEELQHCVYLNALRRQQRPIFGKKLVDLVTVVGTNSGPCRPRPKVPQQVMAWFENDSTFVRSMVPTLDKRADRLKTTLEKFCCVTPAVVTRDLQPLLLGRRGVEALSEEDLRLSAPVRWAPFLPKVAPVDPWHEARMRLSIQFPDKRLLQYDCGKLQALDRLLRKLQAGGHRVLIFTQMTKVLDILEQFLNIHGHKYLRLDGATKVEQRQILTDRFNNDSRILCFILSTRSGGLGINLTGADTVIFYDQDWNPAMDKQCQDRCHRIGQTRDVHIYRLVSEHTIEANILRKASQKQMLDEVVIQEGEFTTDHFNRLSVRDVLGDETGSGVSAADAALDRVLGGPGEGRSVVSRALEQAEDREDVAAARVAEREIEADDADFTERPSGVSTTRQGTPSVKWMLDEQKVEEVAEEDAGVHSIDEYMVGLMAEQLKGTKLELPRDKKKGKKKKGKDTRKR